MKTLKRTHMVAVALLVAAAFVLTSCASDDSGTVQKEVQVAKPGTRHKKP